MARRWDKGSWDALSPEAKLHVYLAHSSFEYCFLNVILPYESECMQLDPPIVLPQYQRELCSNIQFDLPRVGHMACFCGVGFFKTTVAVLGQSLWRIGCDPNLSFILATDCKDNAERYLLDLQKHIEGNEKYNFVFGELYPGPRSQRPASVRWSASEMTVKRTQVKTQPSFKAYGYGSRVTGRRFDIAIVDDACTRENSRTAGEREAVYQFIVRDVRGRLTADKRLMMVIGSFYHYDDAHCRIAREGPKTGVWVVFKYPALLPGSVWPPSLPEGEQFYTAELRDELDYSRVFSAWPEWWTPEKLYEDWIADRHIFSMNRLLQPVPTELSKFPIEKLQGYCRANGENYEGFQKPSLSVFNSIVGIPERGSPKWNQFYLNGIDLDKMRFVISIDPAVGKVGPSKGARSYCVMQLWGVDATGRRILLDMWRRESAPPREFKKAFHQWVSGYYRPGKTKIVYESNAMQKYIALDLRAEMNIPIATRPMTGTKEDEVEALADLMDSGLLLYCWGDTESEKRMGPFEEELSQWPAQATNDTIMAAVHANAFLRPVGNVSPRVRVLTEDAPVTTAEDRGPIVFTGKDGSSDFEDKTDMEEFALPKWKRGRF